MPLIKSTTQVINLSTINPNSRVSGLTVDATLAVQISVTAEVQYSVASNPAPAILEIYTSIGAVSNPDTQPFKSATIPVQSANAYTQITVDVPASCNFVFCKVFNPDVANATGIVVVWVTVQNAS
jgi:hypothetical protein